MKVKYHVFKDYQLDVTGDSDEEIFANKKHQEELAQKRYSFVCMRYHPKRNKIYLGCTNSGGDLLVEFDPATGDFKSCGYGLNGIWDKLEAKIHKGLWLDDKEDSLYFGTTTLSPISLTTDSKGGKLVRYDIEKGKFEKIDTPTPADFYQATCYDPERKKMYMYTMPGSRFGVYDLEKGELVRCDPMESIPHIGCIDNDGGVWGTYGLGRQAFYRYLPDENRYEFPEGCAFPNAPQAANIMYMGAGPIDACIFAEDGFIYTSSALGEVVRIDPTTKAIKYLGKPFPGIRMPGLYVADDGYIYMCGGSDEAPMLSRYDREAEKFEYLGMIKADDGEVCYRCHELVVVDGTVYIGETDNKDRSGYIWACEL